MAAKCHPATIQYMCVRLLLFLRRKWMNNKKNDEREWRAWQAIYGKQTELSNKAAIDLTRAKTKFITHWLKQQQQQQQKTGWFWPSFFLLSSNNQSNYKCKDSSAEIKKWVFKWRHRNDYLFAFDTTNRIKFTGNLWHQKWPCWLSAFGIMEK